MNARRTKNSILFLTTLGVYLGLFMVGGVAPQVFAHSATTRAFEITDEIEVKDDLDRDPGENLPLVEVKPEDGRFKEFAQGYSDFLVEDYKNSLELSRKFEQICPGVCRVSYLTYFPTFDPDLERILGVTGHTFRRSSLEDGYQVTELEINYSPKAGELSRFQAAFSAPVNDRDSFWTPARTLVRENSAVIVDAVNGHLVVVTRLPRAGLESLLVKDAK